MHFDSLHRILIIALLSLFIPVLSHSQSVTEQDMDSYSYEYFKRADAAVGTPEFDALNEDLLKVALGQHDKAAELQYYVLKLRHLCRGSSTKEVLDATELVKQKAKGFGSDKYYFNAYSRAALYLTDNEPNEDLVINLMSNMLSDAKVMKSEFGLYEANRYLSILYRRRNDLLASRKYGLAAYHIYSKTEDPLVKNESIIIRTLIDCSETYPVEEDSVRFLLDEARRLSKVSIDTLRCDYADAKYYALKHDYQKYNFYKQKSISSDRYYKRYYPEGDDVFAATDAAIAGNWAVFDKHAEILTSHGDIKYLYEMAVSYHNYDQVVKINKRLLYLFVNAISENKSDNLDELSVKLGNIELDNALTSTTDKLKKTSAVLWTVSLLFLLAIITALVVILVRSQAATRRMESLIEELKQARDAAQRADELKTRFVQNMSHEIRTPLNALVGFSQLLSLPEGFLTEQEKEDYAGYITNNSSLLTMLIDDILNTADIEAGNYRLSISTANCTQICKYAGKTAEIRVQPGVELLYNMEIPEDFEIESDPTRIQQVLINMITNACKNTEKGSITIGCTTKEVPGFVSFYVEDTGKGVPPEKAEVIFERYIKLDRYKQGTGLGLSICKLISKLLQGDIYLDQNYDKQGARFVFNVPLKYKN